MAFIKNAAKKEVSTKKMSTTRKELDFFSVFTLNQTKSGKLMLKPKLNKFGVAAIKIITNDEMEINLDENSALWAREIEGVNKSTGETFSFYDVSLSVEK